jgi:hypothetical protein
MSHLADNASRQPATRHRRTLAATVATSDSQSTEHPPIDKQQPSSPFMHPITHAQALRQLRQQPTWRLLAAENAPAIMALIQAHLLEGARKLPASLLVERLGRDLEAFAPRAGTCRSRPAPIWPIGWRRAGWSAACRRRARRNTRPAPRRRRRSALRKGYRSSDGGHREPARAGDLATGAVGRRDRDRSAAPRRAPAARARAHRRPHRVGALGPAGAAGGRPRAGAPARDHRPERRVGRRIFGASATTSAP